MNNQYKDYVQNYSGKFPFMLDIQKKFKSKGALSLPQWKAVKKCHWNDNKKNTAPVGVPGPKPKLIPVACDIPLLIKRRAATGIKRDHNLPFYPFTVTAQLVRAKTYKAVLVDVVFTTGSVSVCRCCGKRLEDPRSQATGIGPICAKRYGFPYPKDASAPEIAKFQADLEALAKSIGTLKVWLPLRQIKEGSIALNLIADKLTVSTTVFNSARPTLTKPSGLPGHTSKFKVGDMVLCKDNLNYSITNRSAGPLKVLAISDSGSMYVRLNNQPYTVGQEHFELIQNQGFTYISPETITTDLLRYSKSTKTFMGDAMDVFPHTALGETQPVINVKNSKTNNAVEFKYLETVRDNDDQSVIQWEYANAEKDMKLIILND